MSLNFLLKSFHEEDKEEEKGPSLTGFLQRGRIKHSHKKKHRTVGLTFSPYAIAWGFCMREKVAQLAELHTITAKPPTPKMENMFDMGKHIHEMVQGYFWNIGAIEGYFRCLKCDHEWWDISPKNCPKCTMWRKYLEYREVPLVNDDYFISGRSDGIINLEWEGKQVKHLLDIKSIQNKPYKSYENNPKVYFEDLEEPLPGNIVQLQCYMFMAEIHDAHLLYFAKNSEQMKSFHITYDFNILKPYFDTMLEAITWAEDIKSGKVKELPQPCETKKCECQSIIIKHE